MNVKQSQQVVLDDEELTTDAIIGENRKALEEENVSTNEGTSTTQATGIIQPSKQQPPIKKARKTLVQVVEKSDGQAPCNQ